MTRTIQIAETVPDEDEDFVSLKKTAKKDEEE